jgi:Domain of unknown function (DUF4115)/Helix-turn-helix domain
MRAREVFAQVSVVPDVATTGIGATLRAAREQLGVSIEEAAWRTRIRPDYLRALEDERFEDIGHVFVRGHLSSYARFLCLDATAIAHEYVERFEHSEPSPIERLNERHKEAKRPPKPNWLIAALVAAALLIAASVLGVVRGPGPSTPSGARNPLPSLPATAKQNVQPATPSLAAPNAVPITFVVAADKRAWIRITADGAVVFEGTLTAGESKTFTGRDVLEVVIGNAGAVRVTFNGRDLGAPGKPGHVFRARFGPKGQLTAK